MHLPHILFASLALVSSGVVAADWKPVSGTYALTSENYLDPLPDEPKNSHFRLQLEGEAAKDLYLSIPGQALVDECTGGLSKSAGELQCLYFKDDSKYHCAFSINLLTHTVEYGVAC